MDRTGTRTATRVVACALTALALLMLLGSMSAVAEESTVMGRILDETTVEFIEGATVTITHRDSGTLVGQDVSDEEGRYVVTAELDGWYTLTVEAEGYRDTTKDFFVRGSYGHQDVTVDATMSPVSGPTPQPSPTPTPPYLLYAAVLTIIVVTSVVMYSKIKRDNLLKHAVRRRIHEYVRDNPGAHYRAILDDLDLSMGVLTYHLNRLEKGEYLRSRQDGMYRRFFVTGRRTEVRFFLSDIQESILSTIRENQGISQSGIAESIGVTRKVVNYHVRILDQAGLVYMEERGREVACFARERAPSASS